MRTILTDRETDRLQAAVDAFCGSRRNMAYAIDDVCDILRVDEQTANDMLDNCSSAEEFLRQINCEVLLEEDERDFPCFESHAPVMFIPFPKQERHIRVSVSAGTAISIWLILCGMLGLFILCNID